MNPETHNCRKNFPREYWKETTMFLIINALIIREIFVKNANNAKIIKELDNSYSYYSNI